MKIWRLNFRALSLHCRSYGKSWRRKNGLWNEEDGFFYDVLQLSDGTGISLKLRSIVGLIPMFAVEVIEHEMLQNCLILPKEWTGFKKKKKKKTWISQIGFALGWRKRQKTSHEYFEKTRLTKILNRMLDEKEF